MAAKLTRKLMKVFASAPGLNQIGRFGSLAAGAPTYTTDIEDIQSLSNYLGGWYSAILGNNSPAIQDRNALDLLFSYQLAYLMEMGIPEWNAATEYFIGSKVNVAGIVYTSLVDNNINQVTTDITKWKISDIQTNRTIAVDTTLLVSDAIVFIDSALTVTATLPAVASTPVGKQITVANVHAASIGIAKGNAAELVDGFNTLLIHPGQSAVLCNTGTAWTLLNKYNSVPVGTVHAWTGAYASIPPGYLLCDGAAVSRTAYDRLFAKIGITAGQGDGSTTFNVPDHRGFFLRGTDPTPVRDPGPRTAMGTGGNTGTLVNTVEAQDIVAHAHTIATINGYGGSGTTNVAGAGAPNIAPISGNAAGGSETRPMNAAVTYIIKF